MRIKIDGKEVEANPNETIFVVAKREGIFIPTLCFDPDLSPKGDCRICICEVNGKLKSSCDTKVQEGMVVETRSQKVIDSRRINIELQLARHGNKGSENFPYNELLSLKKEYEITDENRFKSIQNKCTHKNTNSTIQIDPSLCILCGRCIYKCQETQTVNALCFEGRSVEEKMSTPFNYNIADSSCINCGQCTLVCPTGAIREVDNTRDVLSEIENPDKFVVVQVAPSVRATIGEEFGLPAGTLVKKKLVTALRRLGFDRVFDTNFGADLTVVEESAELINRLNNNGVLPMTTSCSPGYVSFAETFFPHLLKHLSSCKSPQQMFGAVTKTYYAQKFKIDPAKIVVVGIMPCPAKKYECNRQEMHASGFKDVDYVLTCREAARLMKLKNIFIPDLPEEEFDMPLGESSGAGAIFAATGGVMEAVLRTAYEFITGEPLPKLEFLEVRGLKGLKEGSIMLKDKPFKYAVGHGLGNVRVLLDEISRGESKYHFIELMACPGGCIGGGGLPIPTNDEVRNKRIQAIYFEDQNLPIRKSHENPAIKEIYKEFLGTPNGDKSHRLLHTSYAIRKVYEK